MTSSDASRADAGGDPEVDGNSGLPLFSPAFVAGRLGVTAATLRTWHYRYELGPTGRTSGGHRRYSQADLERLDTMRDLTAKGIGVAEAARLSHEAFQASGGPLPLSRSNIPEPLWSRMEPAARATRVELLTAAADDLDQVTTGRIVAESLHGHGVLATWADLITPALRRAGERFAHSGDGIHAEHVLSESIRSALSDIVRRDRRWEHIPPTLIAAPDGEHHVLALHALSAALAEQDRPSVLLGASVPSAALVAAAARIEPATIFLWSQNPATARQVDLTRITSSPDRARPAIVLGGPGWSRPPPEWASALVDDLPTALRICIDGPSTSRT